MNDSASSGSCGVRITLDSELLGENGSVTGRAEAYGPGANLALVTVTLPDQTTRSTVYAVDFSYLLRDEDGKTVSIRAQSSACPDEATVKAYVLQLSLDPVRRYGSSAKSDWPNQESATTKTAITVVIPDEVAGQYKDRVKLTCHAKDGTVAQDGADSSVWTYMGFKEEKATLHPKMVTSVFIRATVDGKEVSGRTRLSVFSVFYWLVRGGQAIKHQHGPKAQAHEPGVPDYTAAYEFIRWKYEAALNGVTRPGQGQPVPGFTKTTFLPEQQDINGAAAHTDQYRRVTFSAGAFTNENWFASVVAHELIHTGQSRPNLDSSECEAYTYQLNHASEFGLEQADIDEIQSSKDHFCK